MRRLELIIFTACIRTENKMKIQSKIITLCAILILSACAGSLKTPPPLAKSSIKIAEFKPTFTPPKVDASFYTETLKKLQAKDTTVLDSIDMTRFRFSYLAYRKSIRLFSTDALDKKLSKAMTKTNFNEIEKIADEILEMDFTDVSTHFIKIYAMKKNGKDPSFHQALYKRLIQSIKVSGDGKSPATAFVLSQSKESLALINHFKLLPTTYFTANMSGRVLDIIECKNEKEESLSIYFDITEPSNFSF